MLWKSHGIDFPKYSDHRCFKQLWSHDHQSAVASRDCDCCPIVGFLWMFVVHMELGCLGASLHVLKPWHKQIASWDVNDTFFAAPWTAFWRFKHHFWQRHRRFRHCQQRYLPRHERPGQCHRQRHERHFQRHDVVDVVNGGHCDGHLLDAFNNWLHQLPGTLLVHKWSVNVV